MRLKRVSAFFVTGISLLAVVSCGRVATRSPEEWVGKLFPRVPVTSAPGGARTAVALKVWTFLLCLSGPPRFRPAWFPEYPTVLVDRFGAQALRFAVLMPGSARSSFNDIEPKLPPEISLEYAPNGELQRSLGMPDNTEWTVIVDPGGRIRYADDANLKPEDMRQLAERFLLGRVSYGPRSLGGPQPQGPVPDVLVRQVVTGRSVPLPRLLTPEGTLITIGLGAGGCAVCGQPSMTSVFARLATLLPARASARLSRLVRGSGGAKVLIGKDVSAHEVLATDYGKRYALDIYQAEGYIVGWDDPYYAASDQSPLVITARDGVVLGITPLADWLAGPAGSRQRAGGDK